MLPIKTKTIISIVVFLLIFLATRLPFLGYDEINPDAYNWHVRSEQFIVGLKTGDFLKTHQHYHPGVTLMWITGVPIELNRQLNAANRVYNQDNFIKLHQLAKFSLVGVQLILLIILILALGQILGMRQSLLAVSVLSLEPFFLGNSRLLHMDVLLTLFMILSIVFMYIYILKKKTSNLLLAAFFSALAFLTKSVGGLTIIFICIVLISKGLKNVKPIVLAITVFVVTTFSLFPALWVEPSFVLSDIYNEGLRVGTKEGHEQIILGDQTDAAGLDFYPLILALKTSPFIWFGVLLFVYVYIVNRNNLTKSSKNFLLYTIALYAIYFAGMSVVSKKIDRYMLPLFPALAIFSAVGVLEVQNLLSSKRTKYLFYSTLLVITGLGISYPIYKLYPYYFTYTNPVFGSAEEANKIIGQKPFGIGIFQLKSRLIEKYGEKDIGFIDRKPMSLIYPNSRLYDIRIASPKRYDLIILGPNEELPKNVVEGSQLFVKDDSIYINGLEFWRIYKKVS